MQASERILIAVFTGALAISTHELAERQKTIEQNGVNRADLSTIHELSRAPKSEIISLSSALASHNLPSYKEIEENSDLIKQAALKIGLNFNYHNFSDLQRQFNKRIESKNDWTQAEIELGIDLLKSFPAHYALYIFSKYGLGKYDDPKIIKHIELGKELHHNIIQALELGLINLRTAMQASRGVFPGFKRGDYQSINRYFENLLKNNNGKEKRPKRNQALPPWCLYASNTAVKPTTKKHDQY